MTNKEALEFAKQEHAVYKRKVEDGFTFYQRIADYYDIVVEALEKTADKECSRCQHRNRCSIFDNYDIDYCSDWSEEG